MSNFLKNNLILFFILNSGNIFSYLSQLAIGRYLSPKEFGLFNSLNSLIVIFSSSIIIISMVFSKATVELSAYSINKVSYLLKNGLKFMCIVSGIILFISFPFLPLIKQYLHIRTNIPIIIFFIQVSLSFLFPVGLGLLQGLHRFIAYGISNSAYPFFRFIGVILFVYFLNLNINGALLAGVFGIIIGIICSLIYLNDILLLHHNEKIDLKIIKSMFKFLIPVFINTLIVFAFGNIDIVLVRHYCTAQEAGLYSTAAILGRIGFYLSGVLMGVLFPYVLKETQHQRKHLKTLSISLFLTTIISGTFAIICFIYPKIIISILFGKKYIEAANSFKIISISMSLLAICNVFFTYFLGINKYKFIFIQAVSLISLIFLVSFFHSSAITIAYNLLFSIIIMLIFITFYFFKTEVLTNKK